MNDLVSLDGQLGKVFLSNAEGIGVLFENKGKQTQLFFDKKGYSYNSIFKLTFVKRPKKKVIKYIVRFINVYKYGEISTLFRSVAEADAAANNRICRKEIVIPYEEEIDE